MENFNGFVKSMSWNALFNIVLNVLPSFNHYIFNAYNPSEYVLGIWFKDGLINQSLGTKTLVLWTFPFQQIFSDFTVMHFVKGLWEETLFGMSEVEAIIC